MEVLFQIQPLHNPVYTPPTVTSNTECVITCKVTDNCGRVSFVSYCVTIIPGPRKPIAVDDGASLFSECGLNNTTVPINVLNNDINPDNGPLTVTNILNPTHGTWTTNGTTVYFTPTPGFTGVATANYKVCGTSLCDTASIVVGVGTPDVNGCYPGFTWGVASADTAIAQTNNSVTNPTSVYNSYYEPLDPLSYAVLNASTDSLAIDFGSTISFDPNKKIEITLASGSTTSVTGTIYSRLVSGGPRTLIGTVVNGDVEIETTQEFNLPSSGLRYLIIYRTSGSADLRVDGMLINSYDCIIASVGANNDYVQVNEDQPISFDVRTNDDNPTGLPLSITIIQNPVKGKVSINLDSSLTYINNTDVSGLDSLTYRVCNEKGICSTAKVYLNITDDGCVNGQYQSYDLGSPTTKTLTTIDSWIYEKYNSNNYGSNSVGYIGKKINYRKRIVTQIPSATFRSQIPANAIITSAKVEYTVVGGDNTSLSLSTYQITGNPNWTESGVTWNKRTSSNSWSNPGGDIISSPLSSIQATRISSSSGNACDGCKLSFDVTSAVTNWQNDTSTNRGILLAQTIANAQVDKRLHLALNENSTSSYRPVFTITYALPISCVAIPNRAPLANPDTATTPSNTLKNVFALTNDSDPDGNAIEITGIIGTVTGGTATLSGSGAGNYIIFTPNATLAGYTTFKYRIIDNGGLADTSTVTILMTNIGPIANKDIVSTPSNTSVNINVKVNDSDTDGPGTGAPVITRNTNNGLAIVVGNNIVYTPNTNFTGNDTLIYRICESSAPNCAPEPLCDTAIVIITIVNQPPVANTDNITANQCQPVLINVLANDTDPENGMLTVSIVTQPSNGTAVLVGSQIQYTPNTSFSGPTDAFIYRICDDGNPQQCVNGNVIISINPSPINQKPIAIDDNSNGTLNSDLYITVLSNDNDPDNNPLIVSLSAGILQPSNGALNVEPNGQIRYVPNYNFLGIDSFKYIICDVPSPNSGPCPTAPSKCDTATVYVTILKPDSYSVNPITENGTIPATGGTAIFNVTTNDNINGDPVVLGLGGNATISPVGSYPSGITLNTNTGAVTVAPGTTPGNYPITYQLCDKLIPITCATVVDTVKVTPVINPVQDIGTAPSTGGTAIPNVLSNDMTNGVPSTTTNSTISQIGTWPTGITLNPSTGAVTVAPGTTPGNYPVTYQLCDKLSPPNCATVVDTVKVIPAIFPVTENGTIPATGGTAIPNVLSNDMTNGVPSTTTNSTISQVGSWPTGITLNPSTGAVTVAPGTTPGNYPITYQLCDKLIPVNCASVTDTVKVTPVINPVTENGTVPATGGTAIPNVLNNDMTNGVPSTTTNSTISPIGTYPSGITLNPSNGAVTVAPGTTPGNYPITYQLCDKLSPVNCATVVDTVKVTPVIRPNPDNGTIPTTGGTAIPNILVNDSTNGQPSTPTNSTITPVGTWPPGITLNPTTGAVIVAPGTTPGNYPLTYQLCDKLSPPNCATTTVTINVTAVIKPNPENGTVPSSTGGTAINNVLSNDSTNGVPSTFINSTISPIGTYPTGIALNTSTGAVTVVPGTTPGNYPIVYQLCDRLIPVNCATVTDTVKVTPVIKPVTESGTVSSATGGTAINNVLSNDSTNGYPSTLINSTIAQIGSWPTGISLNPSTGTITVVPGTAPGTYPVMYQLCDRLSPVNCATMMDTVRVTPPLLVAKNDINQTIVNTPVPGDVSINDLYPLGSVFSPIGTPTNGGTIVLNPNGTYTYTPPTGFIGTDSIKYKVCSFSLCDTALLSIEVRPNPTPGVNTTIAQNDEATTPMSTPVNINVKANDTDPEGHTQGFPQIISPVNNGTAVVNGDGTISFTPTPGFVGKTHFLYNICDNGTPIACDTAKVTITVTSLPAPGSNQTYANDDAASTTKNVPVSGNVLLNDTDPQGHTQIITPTPIVAPLNGSVTLNSNGTFTYTPNTNYVGTDKFLYKVCDNGSPTACDTATVYLTIYDCFLPPATISANGPTTFCPGGSVTLTSSSAATYQWYKDGVLISGATNQSYNASTAGNYTVVTKNNLGCTSLASSPIIVTLYTSPLVSSILGVSSVCVNNVTILSSSPSGGVWSSSNTLVATVDVVTGHVLGIAAGTSVISYTVTNVNGCSTTVTQVVTVYANPIVSPILGTLSICVNCVRNLSNATSGGVWSSSNTSIATVNINGQVTGIAAGTTSISYTVTSSNGCSITESVLFTVYPNPIVSPITGNPVTCVGSTTQLTSSPAGGVWSSNNTSVATIDAVSGLVTGVFGGTALIGYTVSDVNGCITTVTQLVTVNVGPLVSPIMGTGNICVAQTTVLSNSTSGGIWTSSNTAVATINSSGVVTGLSAGSAIISYTVTGSNGCSTSSTKTVNVYAYPVVDPITGYSSVCSGGSIVLSSSPSGGVWSSNNAGIATVNSATGVVTGVSAGSAIISYTVTNANGCSTIVSRVVTVNGKPVVDPIAGNASICVGNTTTLSNTTPAGTWSSSNTGVATINSSTGLVTAISAGTTTITYTIVDGNGCVGTATQVVTVYANPVLGSISGTSGVCVGKTTLLINGSSGGVWSSSNTAVATIHATTGQVTGIAAGTSTISYTVTSSHGCSTTVNYTVTVYSNPLVDPIAGKSSTCVGGSVTFSSNTVGGVWSSSDTSVAMINSNTGVLTGVSAGTVVISYTVTNGNGCSTTVTYNFTVKANPVVNPITGQFNVCIGSISTLSNSTSGGVWNSSNTAVATITSNGIVTAVSVGSTTISYMVTGSNGCSTTVTQVLTVYAYPIVSPITGNNNACVGSTTTLSSATAGGVWSSSNTLVAMINATTGQVMGVSAGTATMSYTLSNAAGCSTSVTKDVTISANPIVAVITGNSNVCVGNTITLSNTTVGGVWSSSNTSVATINSTTGEVTAVSAGTVTMSYAVTNSNGCTTAVSKDITVNANPTVAAITGNNNVCVGNTTTLSSATAGGVWSSSNTSIATIHATTGQVTAIIAGTVTMSYSVSNANNCTTVVTKDITIHANPVVAIITGSSNVCVGSTISLSSATTGGVWSSSNTAIATINATTGLVTGVVSGMVTMSYTVTNANNCSTTV